MYTRDQLMSRERRWVSIMGTVTAQKSVDDRNFVTKWLCAKFPNALSLKAEPYHVVSVRLDPASYSQFNAELRVFDLWGNNITGVLATEDIAVRKSDLIAKYPVGALVGVSIGLSVVMYGQVPILYELQPLGSVNEFLTMRNPLLPTQRELFL